jgi:hypothetical protein
VECKIIRFDLSLPLNHRVIRVRKESDFGTLMISELHMIVFMVFLSVLLSLPLKLQLVLKLFNLTPHTLRHVLTQVTAASARYLLIRVEILEYLNIFHMIVFESLIERHVSIGECFMLPYDPEGALELCGIRIVLVGVGGVEDVHELVDEVDAVIH